MTTRQASAPHPTQPRTSASNTFVPDTPVHHTRHTTPLGEVILAATTQGLVGCWFHNQAHLPNRQGWQADDTSAVLRHAKDQLQRYFAGELHTFDLPLHFLWGTPFQQSVWQALQRIAYGQTTTYAMLARQLSRPQASRAVGAAVGRNPLSLIIPCHRVLGARGALTGYAGGLERKQHLLQLESAHA